MHKVFAYKYTEEKKYGSETCIYLPPKIYKKEG